MGDPAGIAPEITLSAWQQRREQNLPPFFVLTDPSLFQQVHGTNTDLPVTLIDDPEQAMTLFDNALPVLPLSETVKSTPGQPDPANADAVISSITRAVDLVRKGQAAAVVTNPINKHVLYQAGFTFPGHTEFLASLAANGQEPPTPVMMLASGDFRTVPLTIHIPLQEVPQVLTHDLIIKTLRIVATDLEACFGISSPRIAVCGLNPHAGESGSIGHQEQQVIGPALEQLKQDGLNVSGPHPADTMFHEEARSHYDVAIGMYHDQALIPIKMMGIDKGVNITLGLPFIRTSPDHGTAYDIAGKGLASPTSLMEALKMAANMAEFSAQQSAQS
jgi:4-hydroxythreonine-4-phosphate dehydrogenase